MLAGCEARDPAGELARAGPHAVAEQVRRRAAARSSSRSAASRRCCAVGRDGAAARPRRGRRRRARGRRATCRSRPTRSACSSPPHTMITWSWSSSQRSTSGAEARGRLGARALRGSSARSVAAGSRTATFAPRAHRPAELVGERPAAERRVPSARSAIVTGRARRAGGIARLACSCVLSTRVRLSASSGSERSSASKCALSIFSSSVSRSARIEALRARVAEQRELAEHRAARERVDRCGSGRAPGSPRDGRRAPRTPRRPRRPRGTATRRGAG